MLLDPEVASEAFDFGPWAQIFGAHTYCQLRVQETELGKDGIEDPLSVRHEHHKDLVHERSGCRFNGLNVLEAIRAQILGWRWCQQCRMLH